MDTDSPSSFKGTVLVIDDSPAYLRLAEKILTERGYTIRMAPNGQRALDYCKIEVPDLILLDIRLPDMDGYQVCAHLKSQETTRDIPILFFSIVEDEQDKAKAFSVGGVDFITKPFLAEELIARIESHLTLRRFQVGLEQLVDAQTQELLKTNQQLREANERYQVWVADNPAGIWHYEIQPPMPVDLPIEEQIDWILHKTCLIETNQVNAQILRADSIGDVIGRSLKTSWGQNEERGRVTIKDWITNGYGFDQYVSSETFADGSEYNGLHAGSSVIENGLLFRIWGSTIDITGRVLAEKESLKKSIIIESTTDAVVTTDLTGKILSCNPAGEKMYGYKLNEFIGENIAIIYPEEELPKLENIIGNLLEGKNIPSVDINIKRKDDSILPVTVALSPLLDEAGNVVELIGAARDNTEIKEAEDKLKESEERYDLALSVTNDGMYDWDVPTNDIFFDSRYYTMAGYEPNEFPGTFDEWAKRVHPEDYKRIEPVVYAYLAGEIPIYDEEFRFKRKDGQWMWIRARVRIIDRDENDAPLRIVGTHTDISGRVQAEEALKESELRARTLVDYAPEAIVIFDSESGKFIDANENALRLFGISRDILGKYGPIALSPENQPSGRSSEEAAAEKFQLALDGQSPKFDWEHTNIDSDLIPCEVNLVKMPWGDRTMLRGSITDISERKQAERELKENEQRLSLVFNSTEEFMALVRVQQGNSFEIETINQSFIDANKQGGVNFELEDVIGLDIASFMQDIVKAPPEKADFIIKKYQQAIEKGDMLEYEEKTVLPDGSVFITETAITPLFDEDGLCNRLLYNARDVTTRRTQQAQVEALSERLALAVNAAQVGIWDWNVQDNVLIWDEAMYTLYGIMADDFGGAYEAWSQGVHQDDVAQADADVLAALRGEKDFETEFRVVWPDGTIRHIQGIAAVHRDDDGEPLRMIGVNWDITEQKEAQLELQAHRDHLAVLVEERTAALQESESRYRAVVEDQTEFISRWEPDGTILFVNDRYCELFNKPREDFIGKKVFDIISKNAEEEIRQNIRKITPEQPSYTTEFFVTASEEHKDRWLQWTRRGIFDQNRKLIVVQNIGRDITERKQAEEALRQRTAELEMFNKAMVDRELRIIEMKKEVNQLCKELGRKIAYPPVWEDSN